LRIEDRIIAQMAIFDPRSSILDPRSSSFFVSSWFFPVCWPGETFHLRISSAICAWSSSACL